MRSFKFANSYPRWVEKFDRLLGTHPVNCWNVFDKHLQGIVSIAAATSPGLINIDPVGGLIIDAPEALPLNKGFQHIDGVVVFFYPV